MFARLLGGLAGSAMRSMPRPMQQQMGPVGAGLLSGQSSAPGPLGQAALQDEKPRQQPAMQFPERPIEPILGQQQMNMMGDQQQSQPMQMGDQPMDMMGQQDQGFGEQPLMEMGQTPIQEQPPTRYFATPDANPSRPPQPTQAGSDDIGLPTSDPSYQYQMQGGVEAYAPQFSYRYRRR